MRRKYVKRVLVGLTMTSLFRLLWFIVINRSYTMTIEQTVEIPANRRLSIKVPPEIPAGRIILTFTPEGETAAGVRQKPRPVFGCAKGQFHMADDFDSPLDDFKEYT